MNDSRRLDSNYRSHAGHLMPSSTCMIHSSVKHRIRIHRSHYRIEPSGSIKTGRGEQGDLHLEHCSFCANRKLEE